MRSDGARGDTETWRHGERRKEKDFMYVGIPIWHLKSWFSFQYSATFIDCCHSQAGVIGPPFTTTFFGLPTSRFRLPSSVFGLRTSDFRLLLNLIQILSKFNQSILFYPNIINFATGVSAINIWDTQVSIWKYFLPRIPIFSSYLIDIYRFRYFGNIIVHTIIQSETRCM